ncbi:MAG: DEAD/DEAH box helicase [Actinomycetes bacterium]
MTVYSGEPPTWVAAVSRQGLDFAFGTQVTARGYAYANDGSVLTLGTIAGSAIVAEVAGQRPRPYNVMILPPVPIRTRTNYYKNTCSCPMHKDCKHVAAALLTARAWQAERAAATTSKWRLALDSIISTASTDSAPGFGLVVELGGPNGQSRGRPVLRPVARGKTGWIKTGASWRDLEYHQYRGAGASPGRDALVELLYQFRSGQASYYGYGEPRVCLDEMRPGVWPLLERIGKAGVPLLAPGGQPARLAGPANVALDLRQPDGGEPMLTATIDRDDGQPLPAATLLIGNPAHGYLIFDDRQVELGPLDKPIGRELLHLVTGGPLTIPKLELTDFLTSYYPTLRRQVTVTSGDGSIEFPEVTGPRLELRVQFEPGHLTRLSWAFAYRVGDHQIRVGLRSGDPHGWRDQVAERALYEQVRALDPLPVAGRELVGLDTAVFVEQSLPRLEAHPLIDVVVEGEPLPYAEAVTDPVLTVAARDSADPDWFDLDLDVMVAGEAVPLVALLQAFVVGQDRLLLESGTWFRIDRPELERLRAVIEEARALEDKPGSGMRITPVQAGLWEELVSLGVVAHQSQCWQRTAGRLLALDELPRPPVPADLRATLRPYQVDGYHWLSLLWDLQLGGVLADDMGLGKTVQTLAMAVRAKDGGTLGGPAGPLLIVAPTSVVASWAEQAAAFCPQLVVVALTETEKRSGRKIAEVAAEADVVLTSYALFRIDEERYRGLTWSGLVLDEAQFVKNHQAKTYQAARKMPAPFKLAITGTPMENSLMDLWSMLSITAPGLFPNPKKFADDYRKPIESGQGADKLVALRRRVRPLMLRRTKEQVASDLPPKTEQVLHVTLNQAHRKIYNTHLNRERQRVLGLIEDVNRNRIAILKSLTTLRQLSLDASLVDGELAGKVGSAKIEVLVEQLREIAAEGHRALVFSQFTRFLGLVRTRLATEGIATCYLDGRTRDRPRRIAEFTEGAAPVFLISLKAGGFGLNLTAADYVFVLDPWWNPAAEAQAIDRAHRIGQDKPVMVYRLIASDTIEEKVVALQDRKRSLFASVVDGGAANAALTAEDIRGLFSS